MFVKLSETYFFTNEIKDKLSKIDEDMKASAHHLSLNPSHSSAHFTKIIYIKNLQAQLWREEARIRAILAKI